MGLLTISFMIHLLSPGTINKKGLLLNIYIELTNC